MVRYSHFVRRSNVTLSRVCRCGARLPLTVTIFKQWPMSTLATSWYGECSTSARCPLTMVHGQPHWQGGSITTNGLVPLRNVSPYAHEAGASCIPTDFAVSNDSQFVADGAVGLGDNLNNSFGRLWKEVRLAILTCFINHRNRLMMYHI